MRSSPYPLPAAGEWINFFHPSDDESQLNIDGSRNLDVFVAGYLKGSVSYINAVGDVQVTSEAPASSAKDVFIAKLGAAGDVVWANVLATSGDEGNVYDLAVDPSPSMAVSTPTWPSSTVPRGA